jgi:pyruvate dehydrogenase E1 component alpha subunit
VNAEIDECVTFAENSPYPDASEMYSDNYVQADYPFITD